jgi:hypothetical protein
MQRIGAERLWALRFLIKDQAEGRMYPFAFP